MLRKMLTMLAVTVVGLFSLGGVAAAAPGDGYGADNVTVNINVTIIIVNGPFIFFGDGFSPGENVTITIVNNAAPNGLRSSGGLANAVSAVAVPAAQANAAGHFDASLTIDAPGLWTISATGQTSGHVVSTTQRVYPVGTEAAGGAAGGGNADSAGGANSAGGGSSTSSGGVLPNTGASVAGPLAIGLAALLAGLALLFFGSRGVIRHKNLGAKS
jgi:LPXTG-motif cell wall-anchored protein